MKASKIINKVMATSTVALTMLQLSTPLITVAANETVVANTPVQTKAKQQQKAPYRNVMYYGDWSVWGGQGNQYPKDLPAGDYTHLNFSFLDFDSNGELKLTDAGAAFDNPVGSGNQWEDPLAGCIPALAAIRSQHPNMRLGVSLGGWSKSGDFSEVSANPTKRANFVKNVMKFIKLTDMDFVDIDWEYPTNVRQGDLVDNKNDEGTPNAKPEDYDNYIKLMQALRDGLDKQGVEIGKTYELSTALPGSVAMMDKGIDVSRLFKIIDFGNVMSYDLTGAFDEYTGHHTGLYANPNAKNDHSVDTMVKYLESKNVQMDKVVIGAAFYTRGWDSVEKGNDPSQPGLFQKASATNKDGDDSPSRGAENDVPAAAGDGGRKGGVWSFRNLDLLKRNIPDLKEYWDDVAKAPYMYSESTKDFYTFENVRSITEKANYVKAHGLGGMISWMASQDNDEDNDGVRSELTDAIAKGLYGNNFTLPSQKEDYELKLNVSAKVELAGTDSGKKGFQISVTNNQQAETSSSDALKYADRYFGAVKKPHFVIKMKDGSTLNKGDYKAGTVTTNGDKTIVDLSTQYDGRYIKQGETKQFKLTRADGKDAQLNEIESIELVQYYNDKIVVGSQMIYGSQSTVDAAPVFSGVQNETITVGDNFNALSGVKATDKEDGDITSKISVTGTVDTTKSGQYELTYSVTDSANNTTTVKRVITVKEKVVAPNEKPVFTGVSNKTITVGDNFNALSGVKATDKEDGDITSKISVTGTVDTTKSGQYELTYSVTDSANNTTTVKRVITVKEKVVAPNEKPVFTGMSNKTITVGDNFNALSGVKATDKEDGDITSKISVTGTVDTTKSGQYELTYSVTDSAKNTTTAKRVITVKEKVVSTGDAADEMVNPSKQVMVGYWHNWASKNDGYQRGTAVALDLDEIDENYNVVDVSFMKASGNSHIPTFKPYNKTDEEFRKEVGELNAKGTSVLLALGGADAHIELRQSDKAAFVKEIINQVDKYGFDGLDIDLEQSAITAAENQTVLPEVLREVKDHYAREGKNFLITMAPEFPYLKANGSYAKYIKGLEGYYDWINPQYYNQGGDGVSGENGVWLAQNNDAKKADFLYALSSALINGTDGFAGYVQIPADKLVIGLPSNPDAAGSGYVKEAKDVKNAMARLTKDNHQIKGLMTWSVNWDAGCDANGKNYNWEFVNRYKDLIDYGQGGSGSVVVDTKPILSGVMDATITVGDKFNALAGITASDKEDGDLTAKIKVTGTVDTTKAGKYELTYSVTDSGNNTTTAKRVVTVKEKEQPTLPGVPPITWPTIPVTPELPNPILPVVPPMPLPTSPVTPEKPAPTDNEWSASKVYQTGDKVTYKGKEYVAKWWTQGDEPNDYGTGPWELAVKEQDNEWLAEKIYVKGDTVTFKGQKYEAQWWTKGDEPGKTSVWAKK
ncbi:Chitinase [Pilibacter termitis]|uniref:chitinase n=1 Tax=Pilibacter termitis TaxID=263852 RepID=A0A1T4L9J9_9ENTE|nr:glycosyl hydrolase family 18 protein [Pilibacter termitis]SJZ51187.1 Chitinase [Pilibacter termitis]